MLITRQKLSFISPKLFIPILALFLIDNNYELWLWMGFPPEKNTDDDPSLDQTGSLAVRWQAERKAAMQTAVEFWRRKHGDKRVKAYLVSAGLEPVAFKNLFPAWEDQLDIMELNKKVSFVSAFYFI